MRAITKQKIKEMWQELWEDGKTSRLWQKKVGDQRYTARTKSEESIISRMRFGQTRLNGTLLKKGRYSKSNCDFCVQEESLSLVMKDCPGYNTGCRELIQNLHKRNLIFKLDKLLQRSSGDKLYS